MKKKFRGLMTGALALALLTFAAAGCAKETGGGDGAPETTPPTETTDVAGGGETGAPETGSPDGGYTEAELLALPEDSGDSFVFDEVDGGIQILRYRGNAEVAVIPATIDGKEVTQIGAGAFRMNSDIKAVVVPESITKIGKEAFYFCTEIERVLFRDEGLIEIGEQAFGSCNALVEINLPDSVIKMGFGTFSSTLALKQIDIPRKVTTLENVLFVFSGLENIEIPDGVTEIGGGTFTQCVNLVICKIPDSVKKISDEAFEKSPNVIIVASPDSYAAQYASERGIEFQAA